MVGPDFSGVDTSAKVFELVEKGALEKMYLHPPEFGGPDVQHNVVYVPVGIAGIKASTDANVIAKLAEEGKVNQYKVRPKYFGNSLIPISVEIIASDPETFVFNIEVWGEGLEANRA